jgi:dehydrogenase/reductase SDR family member 12
MKMKLAPGSPSRAIDTALDRTVVLGYGSVGLALRRHLPGWPAEPPRMDGKVVLVTGAGSGLGLAACQGFAALGATVHALARNERRAEHAVRAVLDAVPGADARPAVCDLSSLAKVEAFTAEFVAQASRLDVLVNNAGVMPYEREYSLDGHELMSQLAPFLERSAPARVILVSSGGMYAQRLPSGDFESEHATYSPKKLYARTKREQLVIGELWAERLEPRGVFVHSMHPGWADTEGIQEYMPQFRSLMRPILRSPDAGADTIVWLGAAPEALQGGCRFWHDRRPRPTHHLIGPRTESDSDRRKLWRRCETLVERARVEVAA